MSYKIISVLWWSEARLVCIEEDAIVFTASLAGHLCEGELCAVKNIPWLKEKSDQLEVET